MYGKARILTLTVCRGQTGFTTYFMISGRNLSYFTSRTVIAGGGDKRGRIKKVYGIYACSDIGIESDSHVSRLVNERIARIFHKSFRSERVALHLRIQLGYYTSSVVKHPVDVALHDFIVLFFCNACG